MIQTLDQKTRVMFKDTSFLSIELERCHKRDIQSQTNVSGPSPNNSVMLEKRFSSSTTVLEQVIANKDRLEIAGSFLLYPLLPLEMLSSLEEELVWNTIQI